MQFRAASATLRRFCVFTPKALHIKAQGKRSAALGYETVIGLLPRRGFINAAR
jgi:hypothetical protein